MTMLNAMPDAYANALLQAMPNPQCTDGRTDGQDEEPSHVDVNLKAVDACDKDRRNPHRVEVGGERQRGDASTGAAACRAAIAGEVGA